MSAPKAEPAKSRYDCECVFVGRRLDNNGKETLWKFELLPDRTPMYFGRIKGVHIGYTYECTDKAISGKPKMTARPREDNPEWEAAEALVDARNAEKLAARKLAENSKPSLKKAIEAMRPLMKGLGYFEREQLIKYLAEQTRGKK